MKKKLFVRCLFVVLLLTTYSLPQTVFACSYPQHCNYTGNDPASGQQSCTGSLDATGNCVWDSSIDPNCSTCTQINSPSPASSPVPTMGPEEKAVYNMNQGLLPEGLVQVQGPPVTETNIFQQFLRNISSLFSGLFFGVINNKPKMYSQSDNLDGSSIPGELLPAGTVLNDNMKDYLGGDTGVYGVNLPTEMQQINPTGAPIGQAEKAFEKANFPEGINPITGQK